MILPWNDKKIALALSGGGIRAMMFHMGTLKYLAENQSLESINKISTVSGGSLLLGLILKEDNYQWPSSSKFLSCVYPTIRKKLCSTSMQWGAARQLLNPINWRYLLSRSNLLAKALRDEWAITVRLSVLPKIPECSINGTTAETGKRFRFKRDSMGDHMLGYTVPEDFPLADALAVSAAFPGGFGPLVLNADNFVWKKRSQWGAPEESAEITKINYPHVHLYDGGVYDNLGLEPFFDAGKGEPKDGVDFIFVSDAGAPLSPGFSKFSLSPWRLKRVADIMSDQAHALRIRTFMNYIQKGQKRGILVYIRAESSMQNRIGTKHPASFPTTLRRVTIAEFDSVAEHGFSLAKAQSQFPWP